MIVAYFHMRGFYGSGKHRYLRRAADVVSAIALRRIETVDFKGRPVTVHAELLYTPGEAPASYSREAFETAIYELCASVPDAKKPDYKVKLAAWKLEAFEKLIDVSHGTLV